jgi:putative flippase GtrA
MEITQKNPLIRFARYSTVGVATFTLDLGLLFLLTDYLGVHYLFSAGLAFAVAVSINYLLSRRHVFSQTTRPFASGFVYFVGIALIALAAIVALMYIAVDILQFHYLISRIFIAGVVGVGTYLMNLYLNFRVAGG